MNARFFWEPTNARGHRPRLQLAGPSANAEKPARRAMSKAPRVNQMRMDLSLHLHRACFSTTKNDVKNREVIRSEHHNPPADWPGASGARRRIKCGDQKL